ncbi:hypothetical protein FRC08_017052 [Ceratobasidium sp. 394]|nr:hypothetical protein FRC08_017052 [Ceratobasidium sp. 394]KAG9093433.1 hypothetical protein FS749_014382 [Ceratobasidium sp. UAMH 11750]
MASTSRNDIFSTSWQSSDSLVPAPPPVDLVRRRTTGPAWRRPRKSLPPTDTDELAPKINLGDTIPPHAEPIIRTVPGLRLQTSELADADIAPLSLSSSRTSSFFDISPNTGLFPPQRYPPTSPYSTRSVSTTSLTGTTSSSTNPSLAASLPPSPPPPLAPIQLRFSPRPELKLGQGRFSQVYLAASRQPSRDWRVCVVKRLEPDEESQALGLREAWFLRQLQTCVPAGESHPGQSFITRLQGVEVEEKEVSCQASPGYFLIGRISD